MQATRHTDGEDEPRRSTNAAQVPNAAPRWRGRNAASPAELTKKAAFRTLSFFLWALYIFFTFLCFFLFFSCFHCAKTAHFFVIFTNAPRITPPSGEGKPHTVRASGEGNERQTSKASRRAFIPFALFSYYIRIYSIFSKMPHNAPNFAAIAFLAIGGTFTPPTPQTRQGHALHNRDCIICTICATDRRY